MICFFILFSVQFKYGEVAAELRIEWVYLPVMIVSSRLIEDDLNENRLI